MKTLIERLMSVADLNAEMLKKEHIFLSKRLSSLRNSEEITNDAYLAAGAIEGGIELLSSLVGLGVDKEEINLRLQALLERAERIDSAHPNLGTAIGNA